MANDTATLIATLKRLDIERANDVVRYSERLDALLPRIVALLEAGEDMAEFLDRFDRNKSESLDEAEMLADAWRKASGEA